MKRSNFYPNGEMIDFRLPQDFRKSEGRGSCGIVVNTVTKDHSVMFIKVLVSKIFMYVNNGDKDFLKDNV